MTFTRKWHSYLCLVCVLAVNGCAQQPSVTSSDTAPPPAIPSKTEPAEAKEVTTPPVVTAKKPVVRKPKNTNKQSQQSKSAAITPQLAKPARSNYPPVAFDSPFKLKYGQKRSLPNSDLNFKISKVSDHRCPLEMQCVHPGNAVITLSLYRNEERIDSINIMGNNSSYASITDRQFAYHIQLLDLQPYPTVQFIELQHYVAEVVITQAKAQ
ncbi:MAG: hypothetical protein AMJ53_11100 [Gammaproteobacteria bacterium SG8_11]|nr:MAG: hypothetical protein AMJ53_11100 [Gammaproteobacteria bacterium SG8_11]